MTIKVMVISGKFVPTERMSKPTINTGALKNSAILSDENTTAFELKKRPIIPVNAKSSVFIIL
jgi:hypothetical protein